MHSACTDHCNISPIPSRVPTSCARHMDVRTLHIPCTANAASLPPSFAVSPFLFLVASRFGRYRCFGSFRHFRHFSRFGHFGRFRFRWPTVFLQNPRLFLPSKLRLPHLINPRNHRNLPALQRHHRKPTSVSRPTQP